MSADRLFSRLNPLLVAVLQSPAHVLFSWALVVLTVTGRKSGRTFRFPVGYQSEGSDALVVMVSEARGKQWWRNFREEGPVEVRLRGRARRGRAHCVDPYGDDFRRLVEQTVRRVPGMDRVFGIRYDRAQGLRDEQVRHLAQEIAAVRIRLDPAEPSASGVA